MVTEGVQRAARVLLGLRSRMNIDFASACPWKGRSGGRLVCCWDGDVVRDEMFPEEWDVARGMGCRERNGMSRDGTLVARGMDCRQRDEFRCLARSCRC